MTSLSRRWREGERDRWGGEAAPPSYDDLKIESEIYAYVVGEGHHDKAISELAWKFSPRELKGDAVERAVLNLVSACLLSIEGGRAIPGPAALAEGPDE